MRGERPGSTNAQSPRPRREASKRSLREAPTRTSQPPGAFAGCSRSCDRHSSDRDWPHGARLARAATDDHSAPGARPARAAGGVARRPSLEVEQRQVFIADPHRVHAIRIVLTTRPVPGPVRAAEDRPSVSCLALLQDVQHWDDRAHGRDLHPTHLPLARQPPALLPGRERESKKNLTAWILMSQAWRCRLAGYSPMLRLDRLRPHL